MTVDLSRGRSRPGLLPRRIERYATAAIAACTMPSRTPPIPKLRRHKASGQAAAVLNGVAAAYGVHAEARGVPVEHDAGVNEIQRLTEGFASELHKLEESLQILSAYVVRLGARSSREVAASLH